MRYKELSPIDSVDSQGEEAVGIVNGAATFEEDQWISAGNKEATQHNSSVGSTSRITAQTGLIEEQYGGGTVVPEDNFVDPMLLQEDLNAFGAADCSTDEDTDIDTTPIEGSSHSFPQNMEEVRALSNAMQPSRDQFRMLTGQSSQAANTWDNYVSQWGVLQMQLNALWHHRTEAGRAPCLVAIQNWTGGILNWRSALRINESEPGTIVFFPRALSASDPPTTG